MWICPKCGRTFKKQNQSHYCGKKPETIDEYIKAQLPEIQTYLFLVRKTIHEAIPEAEERISWGMPTFWKNENIIHFAANKKHIGLYAGVEVIEFYSERLSNYKTSKGTIQFLYTEPIPYDFIADIAKWCYQNIKNKG